MKIPFFLLAIALAMLLALPLAARAQNLDLPAANLRGYGRIAARFTTGADASVTRVEAQDVARAQLLQAKFLSDLSLLPGVDEITLPGGKISARRVAGQGVVAAVRAGTNVFLVAATDAQKASDALRNAGASGGVSRAQVAVPMWLDRFDRFNFRFYYRPWEVPPGQNGADYDFTPEFDFARAQNRAGLVFWNDMLANDSAEGLMNYGFWDWAYGEAKKRDLPVGINSTFAAPTWMLNRFRDQTQLKMPGFVGNFHRLTSAGLGGDGVISWASQSGQDADLGQIQSSIARFARDGNVTSLLEPHGELYHGAQDIFMEYGPVADASYRQFLRGKYGTINALNARWNAGIARAAPLQSWDAVRVPELVHFAGWNAQSLDLAGPWRVAYEELEGAQPNSNSYPERQMQPSKAAPAAWFAPEFDDAAWPQIVAPGDDVQLYTPKRPAVFRRHFAVDAAWKAAHPRVWLYLWDLNQATDDIVRVTLNGREVGTSRVKFVQPHWAAFEVSQQLVAGENLLAVRLPQGYISYKTYLSPVAPRQYPDLGAGLNAQWADFADWGQHARIAATRRGIEMIRGAAPGHQITLMAPGPFVDGIKQLAREYGGNFHDTGFMSAFYSDYLPGVMRGTGLPFTLEPSAPAANLAEFKQMMGLWQTEGVQGVDYFIHIGNVLWNPEIRACFEANRRQISLLGQSHAPRAQTAILYDDRAAQLTGYPWDGDYNEMLGGGYWKWNAGAVLRGSFAYDGLTQSSFVSGDAANYRAIIDSNTTIMDAKMVSEIEAWVRAGGTFVTLAQSGRHTPETPDSWPIARLSGFDVTRIDAIGADGNATQSGVLTAAPAQEIMGAAWNGVRANGLHLKANAPDARPLLLWDDGSVAAGYRALGRGFVVELGAKFGGAQIFDRVEPGGNNDQVRQLRDLLSALLDWRGIAREPGVLSAPNEQIALHHAVSNNGLYDVWTLWNQSDAAQNVTLQLPASATVASVHATDARDGAALKMEGASLALQIEPLDTRAILTPRGAIARAPLEWLRLQRDWWRGADAAPGPILPAPTDRFARDLSDDWAFQSLDEGADATPMLAVNYNDAAWQRRTLGIWNAADENGRKRAVWRRSFRVPAAWNAGQSALWITSWFNTTFVDNGRVWLDGRELRGFDGGGLTGAPLPALTPGSEHVIALEVRGAGAWNGVRGQSWLAYRPDPLRSLDLAGAWEPSSDALNYGAPVNLPGDYNAQLLAREFDLPARARGKTAMLSVDASGGLVGALVNGRLVRRHHHTIGESWTLNVTPFLKWGARNSIQLVSWERPAQGTLRRVALDFYAPGVYP